MKRDVDAKRWLIIWMLLFAAGIVCVSLLTAWLDPFFHYHAPREEYFYKLDHERAQNDGILKQFSYDAVITGTSVTQNFKTSEFDALFGTSSVKTCFAGATYREIADRLETAFSASDIRYVVRSLDVSLLVTDRDELRADMGEYPEWLYNETLLDDIQYLYNLDVLSDYCVPMLLRRLKGEAGGMTPFDEYSSWDRYTHFGTEEVAAAMQAPLSGESVEQRHMSGEERRMLRENLGQNVIAQIEAHPETTFFLFFPPGSLGFWKDRYREGTSLLLAEAMEEAMRLLLPYENVRLFCFSADEEITTDPANYSDVVHYGPWINSRILEAFSSDDETYRVTEENRAELAERLKAMYTRF